MDKVINQKVTEEYAIYEGDSCEIMPQLPDGSIGLSIHSPPFEGLYKFSNSDRDVSNSNGEDFYKHYGFIVEELHRITKDGRIAAVHCMQLPTSITRDGFIGMRDFRGEIIRLFQSKGWIFHSEVCIWKDPVIAQQRTKSIRLLHKQVDKDSTISGQCLADYMVMFRKKGKNEEPVRREDKDFNGRFEYYIGEGNAPEPLENRLKRQSREEAERWYSIEVWQRYASPVWMDINQTRTLQYRGAKDEKDEQHISPLQLDVIERCVHLWSNPNDIVFTPFMGIGSEVYGAVELGRKGIGIELKPTYYSQAVKNLDGLKNKTNTLL
jgi:DNA modification methylase